MTVRLGPVTEGLQRKSCLVWNPAVVLKVSLTETPLTGEPDAGEPLVRFGGRGGANPAIPTPIKTLECGGNPAKAGATPLWARLGRPAKRRRRGGAALLARSASRLLPFTRARRVEGSGPPCGVPASAYPGQPRKQLPDGASGLEELRKAGDVQLR